jgi:hypothetical protein
MNIFIHGHDSKLASIYPMHPALRKRDALSREEKESETW